MALLPSFFSLLQLLFALLLLLTVFLSTTSSAPVSPITVSTPLGNVTGFISKTENGETRQFWNIPFAHPPVGNRRWSPPEPLTRFPTSPLDATNTTNRPCGQSGSEDCLYLTLTLPSSSTPKPSQGFPVLLYIYGGAFTGSNILDASPLVAYSQAFIYVSVNYRLGLLGFFPQVDLTAENAARGFPSSGNQGIMDQTAAMRWVHQHIQHFDGDPARVTIAGESAGSASVCMQILSPAAAPLFHGAIAESGACDRPIAMGGTLTQREKDVGDVVTSNGGCASQPPGAARLACLRALSWDEINHLQNIQPAKPGIWGLNFSPIADGVTIPDEPLALLASGRFHRVPLLIGTNRGETAMYLYGAGQNHNYTYTRADVNAQISYYSDDPALVAELQAYYTNTSHYALADNIARTYIESSTACIFRCPTRTLAWAMSGAGQPVYVWLSDFLDKGSWRWLNVTVHTQEMAHVYRTSWTGPVDDGFILAAQMQNQWLRFVLTHSPNTPILADAKYSQFYANDPLPDWPEYSKANNVTINIRNYEEGKTMGQHFFAVANIDQEECDLWDQADNPWYATAPTKAGAGTEVRVD